jgi:hypothetical protein
VTPFAKRNAACAVSNWNDPREDSLMTTAVRPIQRRELERLFAAADAAERMRQPATPGEAFERVLAHGWESDTLPYARPMPPPILPEYESTTLVMPRRAPEDDAVTLPRVAVVPRSARSAPRRRSPRIVVAAITAAVILGTLMIDTADARRVCRAVVSYVAASWHHA